MGVVEALGDGVEGIKVGDRVGCFGANVACHAERVVVPQPLCLRLPGDLEDRWGAFAALGGIAAHAVRVAEVEAGATVVVIGLGLVGQLVAQLASAAGGRVIGVDLSRERVAKALELGATAGATLGADDAEGMVRGATSGQGADSVIVSAATKDSAPVELAAQVARDRATIAVVGDVGLEIPRAPFYDKELDLRVSRSYGPGRYDPSYEREGHDYPIGYVRWTERRLIAYFFEEVAAGRVRLGELVTHELPVERVAEAYEALSDEARLAILLRYEASVAPIRRSETAPRRVPGRAARDHLRVGVVGVGNFARSTLLPELARQDVELVGVATRTPARAASAGRRWKAAYAAASPDELIEDDSIDVVVIATRHDSHAELAARALEGGKAVFLEKPLAIDEDGVTTLEPLLAAGGRLVVDFNRGFAPAIARVRSHLGERGEPLSIGCRVNAGNLDPSHWLRDPSEGGGTLVGEGCHFVDLAAALVGRALESVQVTGIDSGPNRAATDSFVLTLVYEDGSVATVTYLASGPQRMGKERLEVIGGARSAVVDDFRRVVLYGAGRPRGQARRTRRDKGHAALLSDALRFFRDGGEPPIPYPRLVETTRATLIAAEALASGRREPIAVR
jgi:predicted dehydrogenase/threonine dehydrogenase-like Zn-dependent dehydrogenase